jgi:elongation factor Ts
MADISDIKKLRKLTGAGIADCREILEETGGDIKKAKALIEKRGVEKAEKRGGRETKALVVDSYVHPGRPMGSLVSLSCETDFVARNPEFKNFVHEIAMQVASMNPKNVDELVAQEYIRQPGIKISDLVKRAIAKFGENIKIEEIVRFPSKS